MPAYIVFAFALVASDIGPLVWGLPTALGFYFFVRGFSLLARRRLLLSTPQSKIRSAAVGLVEVSGLATGPFTLNAPVTGLRCFYYRTVAWEGQESGRNSTWKKAAEEVVYVPFFLDDDTGKLLVDPRGAELDLHRDFRQEFSDSIFSTADAVPDNVRNFLLRHGVSCESKVRVEEYCIKPRNALFIVGSLAENPSYHGSSSASSRSSIAIHEVMVDEKTSNAPEVIYLSPSSRPSSSMQMTQQEKVAAALLKAGITKPAAWEAAGLSQTSIALATPPLPATADRQQENSDSPAIESTRTPLDFDLNPPVVLMKGRNDKTLVISWRSESALARSLGWKSVFMLSGGPVLVLVGIYLLLAQLELL